MAKRFDTRTEGLDAYVYMAKTFADTPWLHYGIWEPDERVVVPNVRRAQERYVDKLFELMPAAPCRVFDVGGGTGAMAGVLRDRGYSVEMLTPSSVQIEAAREHLGEDVVLHNMMFEDYSATDKFDVILFSESFQYIALRDSLPRLKSLLTDNGVIIIADCFRSDGYKGGLVPGGGHLYREFETAIAENNFEVISNWDVTDEVAPSMIIDQNFYRGFLAPLLTQLVDGLKHSRPILHWFAAAGYKMFTSADARYRLKERLKADYRSPEKFKAVNTYRFIKLKPN